MEVLQAAPMECIDEVSPCPGLLKFGVQLVAIGNFKQEVRCRDWNTGIAGEFLDLLILENKNIINSRYIEPLGSKAIFQ